MSINHTCLICLEPVIIPEGETVASIKKENLAFTGHNALSARMDAVATTCDHVFHESCLKDWIQEFENKTRAATCPACRTELMPSAVQIIPQRVQHIAQNVQSVNQLHHRVGGSEFVFPQALLAISSESVTTIPENDRSPFFDSNMDEIDNVLNTHQEVNFSLEPMRQRDDGDEIDDAQTRFYIAFGLIHQLEFPITDEQIQQLRSLVQRATIEQIMQVGRMARSLGNALIELDMAPGMRISSPFTSMSRTYWQVRRLTREPGWQDR